MSSFTAPLAAAEELARLVPTAAVNAWPSVGRR